MLLHRIAAFFHPLNRIDLSRAGHKPRRPILSLEDASVVPSTGSDKQLVVKIIHCRSSDRTRQIYFHRNRFGPSKGKIVDANGMGLKRA